MDKAIRTFAAIALEDPVLTWYLMVWLVIDNDCLAEMLVLLTYAESKKMGDIEREKGVNSDC